LHTKNLNVDRLQGVLRRTIAGAGLLAQLNPWSAGAPELPEIAGTFKADSLSAGKLAIKNAFLQLHLQGHRADLVAISGTVFGGTLSALPDDVSDSRTDGHPASESASPAAVAAKVEMRSGAGSAQWGDGPPKYILRLGLEDIQPAQVGALWHEKWGRGTATVEIRMKTQGWSTADLAQNASGNFAIDWRGGTLACSMPSQVSSYATEDTSGVVDGTPGVTRFQRLRAVGHFRDEKLTLEFGQLALAGGAGRQQASRPGVQLLSGTVAFSRVLDLRLQPSGVSISGPLDMPVMQARTSKILGDASAANPENR
jgi:hypothetical protein